LTDSAAQYSARYGARRDRTPQTDSSLQFDEMISVDAIAVNEETSRRALHFIRQIQGV
jgi:hypothetical protein